jgi:hypothetical protein
MYDVNPLGVMMHLKELERQATPQLRPLRLEGSGTLSDTMIAVVRRLLAVASRRAQIERPNHRREPVRPSPSRSPQGPPLKLDTASLRV